MSPGWPRFLFWLAVLVFLLVAIWLLSSILLPFAAGFIIAYFLDPAADRLEAAGLRRWLATLLVLIGFFLTGTLLLLLLVPVLQQQVSELIDRLPALVGFIRGLIERLLLIARERLPAEDIDRLRPAIGARLGDVVVWLGSLLQGVLTSGIAIINVLSLLFVTPIVAFFLLRDWDKIVLLMDGLIPRQHLETVRAQAREVDETLAGFVRGQALVCLILGAFYAIALTAAGLDFGLIIGVVVGVLTFIPFVGAAVGGVLSIGLALVQFDNWTRVAIIAAIFVLGQVIEGNFITPKLVGDRVRLHPVWVIFALLAFGALFGFLGVLLAVPIAAMIGVLVRFGIGRYLESTLYDPTRGREP